MPLPDNEIKCELSYAYLHAIAARAGCECQEGRRHSDNQGVDARLFVNERFGAASSLVRFTVEIQLKATSTPLTRVGNRLSFSLTVEHYDKPRMTEVESPLLLVVLELPPDAGDWLRCSPQALTIKRCAYWVSLRGAPASANDAYQTVYLPRENRFTVPGLRELLARF
jgi:hypothetical protein